MINLQLFFANVPYNKDFTFSKSKLPTLPPCFKPTLLGEFRFGMLGQYRCRNLHAYDFGNYWVIHKDRRNPETHPIEHLIEDAPHWLAIGIGLFIGACVAIRSHLTRDDNSP